MVIEVVHEDVGEGNTQCTNHPHKNSTPGGICAFCLQEKLGKLVSSSFPVTVLPSSSSSSSASFRSDNAGGVAVNDTQKSLTIGSSSSDVIHPRNGGNDYRGYCTTTRRSRLPFVLTTSRRKKKKDGVAVAAGSSSSDPTSIVLKRSKSTTTPRRRGMHFFDERYGEEDDSPHRRGFWPFLYLSKHHSSVRRNDKKTTDSNFTPTTNSTVSIATTAASTTVATSSVSVGIDAVAAFKSRDKKREDLVAVDENSIPLEGQVSRSRSVGCGSRSFSGDIFERISTGLGDCTLRRVESQKEGKPKALLHGNNGHERVRCGGLFSGFMITSSSSYWIDVNRKSLSSNMRSNLSHVRSRSWGWALASPIRAFTKPSSSSSSNGRRVSVAASNKNVTPNLAAIPSLLAASG